MDYFGIRTCFFSGAPIFRCEVAVSLGPHLAVKAQLQAELLAGAKKIAHRRKRHTPRKYQNVRYEPQIYYI